MLLLRDKKIAASKRFLDTKVMDTNIHLDPNEPPKPLNKRFMFFRGYWNNQAKCDATLDEDMRRYIQSESDVMPSHRRLSLNKIYKPTTPLQMWAYRISIAVAIIIMISLFFIPFPVNLFIFIVALVTFLVVSFYLHVRHKRKALTNEPINSLSKRVSRDHSFVDVPLEPLSISEGSYGPPLINS